MTQNGKLVTCDRCGKSTLLKHIGVGSADGGYTHWDEFEKYPQGWEHENVKIFVGSKTYVYIDLCPDCSGRFYGLCRELYADFARNTDLADKNN